MQFSFWRIFSFLGLGFLIILGFHYLFYRSLISFFSISRAQIKMFLLAGVSLLAFIFFFSMFFARDGQSLPARFLYVGGFSWISILINLLLAALIIWLLSASLRAGNVNFKQPVLAGAVFILSLFFSAYGFWNAFHVRVKEVSLSIRDLPAQWRGAKIVQLSDIHLGQVHSPYFMSKLVAQVNAQEPDLILITGDLFDGMDGDLAGYARQLNKLEAKKGIFFVSGNHETYLGTRSARIVLDQTGIRVLDDEFIELEGLQIVGISYPERQIEIKGESKDTEKIISSFLGFDKNKPTILLHHAPTNIEQAKAAGVNLQLSGHTHLGQLFPFNLITRAIYGPYHYGLHTEGDFSIYTTNGQGTWGPPMRTFNRPEIPVIIFL